MVDSWLRWQSLVAICGYRPHDAAVLYRDSDVQDLDDNEWDILYSCRLASSLDIVVVVAHERVRLCCLGHP